MQALIDRLAADAPASVLLVCAGTFRELALEDVLAAGMLAAAFPQAELTDAARVALALYREHQGDVRAGLAQAKNGRVLISRGRQADVDWCGQVARFPVVGVLCDGVIRKG